MQIQKTILPNGIKILTENISHIHSFSLGFWFNAGSMDETAQNNGISHFLEHMLFKGTEKRNARQIAEDIESLGGYLNAFTSKEHTCYYGRGLTQHLGKTFEVIADMIQNSVFDPEEVKKEIGVVVDELNDIEDTPEELIFDKFETHVFKGNSLKQAVIGKEENIKSFTHETLVEYKNSNYGYNNLTIVASGALKHDDIVKFAEKFFTKDIGKVNKKRKSFKTQPVSNLFVEKDIQQTHLIIGKPVQGIKHNERAKVSVLSQILGEGSSSRLFQVIREKNGIAYQINTFLNSFYDISSFGVYISTNDQSFEKAYKLIKNECKKISEKKVSAKELDRAKAYLKGTMIMSLEGTTNRMMRVGQSEIYLDRIKSVEEVVREIEEVTVDDILQISNEIFATQNLTSVVIGSKKFELE